MATRIPTTEITGVRGAMVKRFTKKMLGQVPEPLGVYWHNPKVLKGYLAIGGKSQKWDACDPSLKSFAHMAVASLIGCSGALTSATSRPTTRTSTSRRRARCRAGASRMRSRHSSVT